MSSDQYGRHAAGVYEVVAPGKVEPKTAAATVAGGGSAAVVTPFVLWGIDELWFGGGELDVPLPVVGIVGLIVTGACTFAAGYYARHVNRSNPA